MSRTRVVALSLMLITLAVYLPSVHHGFTLYDDTIYLSENATVQQGLTWSGVHWAFTTFHADNWHPLTWLSLMLDCQLFGFNAGASHFVNALLHSLNAVLLLLLLLRWLRPISTPSDNLLWPCAFVAALFAWHPLHVESVAWIAERKDVLSTFFALSTLLLYERYVSSPARGRSALRPLVSGFYLLALVAFACSLMAKPMYVTLPCLMLLLDWWPLGRFKVPGSTFKVTLEKIPFFVLVIGSCVLTFEAQRHGGAVVSLEYMPLWFRFENAIVAVARYLLEMIWPLDLAIFYPLQHVSMPVLFLSSAVLLSISMVAWRRRHTRPYLLLGWLWFLGTLLPVIGLVQVGGAAGADRYTYFPSIGIFLAIALAAYGSVHRNHFARVAVAALGACLLLTSWQLSYWRDDIVLFSHAAAVTKNNDTAHLNCGYALQKAGRPWDAVIEYRAALKINPQNVRALNDLGLLLDAAGRNDEALKMFRDAIALEPRSAAARNNLGTLLAKLGRSDEALKEWAESVRVDPSDWHAPFLIGNVLLRQGRDAEALSYFRQSIRIEPDNPTVLLHVSHVLASDEAPAARDGRAAFLLAQKANDLTGRTQPAMIDAVAMAYAELGQFDDARNAAQDALTLATRFQMTNDIPLIAHRLELYKNNQPFRQSFKDTPAAQVQ